MCVCVCVCVCEWVTHIFLFPPLQLINDYDKLGIQVLLAAPARKNIVVSVIMSQ